MHHNSVFNIMPCDSGERFFFWWLCNLALASFFPLYVFLSLALHLCCLFSTLLQFVTLPLSVLFVKSAPCFVGLGDSDPPRAAYLPTLPSLSSPCCSFPHYKDVFLVNTYYLAPVFLPLFLSVTVFSPCIMLERICPCSVALCSWKPIFLPIPPHLLPLLETTATRDQNSLLNTINSPTKWSLEIDALFYPFLSPHLRQQYGWMMSLESRQRVRWSGRFDCQLLRH